MTSWLVLVGLLGASPSGCTKDTDCKGDRICEAGQCVSPPAPAVPAPSPAPAAAPPAMASPPAMTPASPPPLPPPPPPPAAVNPSDYPKVIRRNGVTCIQTLGDDGVVREDCRVQGNEYSGTRRPMMGGQGEPVVSPSVAPRVEQAEPRASGFVGDLGALGGVAILSARSGTGALPGVGLHLMGAGRVSDVVGVGGLFNALFLFGSGGFVGAFTFAPALRLGDRNHATLALGPTLLAASTFAGSSGALSGTFMVHDVLALAGGFGLHSQIAITFDASGALFTFAVGFGGSSF